MSFYYDFNGLLGSLGQPALSAPRGVFGGRVVGDTVVENIVPSIRHARVPGPTLAGISSPASTASSAGTMYSVPLNSPPTHLTTNPSLYETVGARLGSAARFAGGLATRAAAALASLGPLGIAIAAAAVVATALGVTAYYLYKRSESNIHTEIDNHVDDVLPPVGRTPKVEPFPGPEVTPVPLVDWSLNVPWIRRPGKDIEYRDICGLNSALCALFKNTKIF